MQSETVQWDMTQLPCGSKEGAMLLLFLLVVVIVVGRKIARVWRIAKPFHKRLPENQSEHVGLLKHTIQSLARWIQLTFLLWVFFVTVSASKISQAVVTGLTHNRWFWWCAVREIVGITGAMVVVVTGAFLLRWSLERRLERIDKSDSLGEGTVT